MRRRDFILSGAAVLLSTGLLWADDANPAGQSGDATQAILDALPSPCVVLFAIDDSDDCRIAKDRIVPWLRRSGWRVVVVNMTRDRSVSDALGIDVVPTFMVVRNHADKGRYTGISTAGLWQVLNIAIKGDSVPVLRRWPAVNC